MTNKLTQLYNSAGTSRTPKGEVKVRFCVDKIGFIKRYHKGGETEIELYDLPESMDRVAAAEYLATLPLSGDALYAVTDKVKTFRKESQRGEVKVAATPEQVLSAIRARPVKTAADAETQK